MEDKYFHLGVAIELLKGIRACVVTLTPFSNIGIKMKEGGNNNIGRPMIYFLIIIQSYKKKITFAKRQAIAALIISNKKKQIKISEWKCTLPLQNG